MSEVQILSPRPRSFLSVRTKRRAPRYPQRATNLCGSTRTASDTASMWGPKRRCRASASYRLRISSRTFFGASSNWSVSIEYDARPFVSERIAVA